ncbi:hypothetical protein M569_12732, partial [Genlisea aurea]
QALFAQRTIANTVENTIEATRSRLDRFLTTASIHFDQTAESFQDFKFEYHKYEAVALGKIKESFVVASSHPYLTTGAVLGLGFISLKGTRQYFYYNTLRFFVTEEKLVSRADAKVKQLKQSFDALKLEGEKLEKRALEAEEDLLRGRTKLKQAGKQIQTAINSAYKIERQASGLKDVLKDLPSIESSRFRKQVTNLAKEAKKERNALSKEVTKISNYGISV